MAKTKKSAARSKPDSSGPLEGADAARSGQTELSFEGALERLEETVGRLEEGEMPLEEALALFEQGVALSRQCTTTLEAAEKRVEMLVAGRGEEWLTAPFEADDGPSDSDMETDSPAEAEDEDFD